MNYKEIPRLVLTAISLLMLAHTGAVAQNNTQAGESAAWEMSAEEESERGMPAFPDFIPVPAFDVPVPPLDFPAPTLLGDTLLDARCTNSAARVNIMEESILNIKARYWAARIKEGRASGLISNPGSEILSPEIRRRFYGLLKSLSREQDLSRPNHFEIYQMTKTMKRILRLIQTCGGEAPELARAIRQTTGG